MTIDKERDIHERKNKKILETIFNRIYNRNDSVWDSKCNSGDIFSK